MRSSYTLPLGEIHDFCHKSLPLWIRLNLDGSFFHENNDRSPFAFLFADDKSGLRFGQFVSMSFTLLHKSRYQRFKNIAWEVCDKAYAEARLNRFSGGLYDKHGYSQLFQ